MLVKLITATQAVDEFMGSFSLGSSQRLFRFRQSQTLGSPVESKAAGASLVP